jgi:hypothetical protein
MDPTQYPTSDTTTQHDYCMLPCAAVSQEHHHQPATVFLLVCWPAVVDELQDPATQAQAEQVLLQFRSSPGVLPACRHILEHSTSCEARFHAACALREGLLREWASLTDAERQALRMYLLQYVLVHAAEPQLQVVRSILQGTLAVMLKRGWMELSSEGRAAFFQVMNTPHLCSRAT